MSEGNKWKPYPQKVPNVVERAANNNWFIVSLNKGMVSTAEYVSGAWYQRHLGTKENVNNKVEAWQPMPAKYTVTDRKW